MAMDESPVARVLLPIEVDCVPEAIASGPMATAWVAPVACAVQPMAILCLLVAVTNLLPSDAPIAIESSPNACAPRPTAIALPTPPPPCTPLAIVFVPIAIELASVACAPVPTATVSPAFACAP